MLKEYTVKQLAEIAGVSVRTLHWYDEKGLLKPARITQAGYRMYTQAQLDVLQHIMFWRALDMPLDDIKQIISNPDYDIDTALLQQRAALVEKRTRLNTLINTLDKTLSAHKGEITMTDNEKFEGFKKQAIDKNEKQYGNEVRAKYGNKAADDSNAMFSNLTKQQYDDMTSLGSEILSSLEAAVKNGENPCDAEGQRIAAMHKKWLLYTWPKYTKQAHAGLAQMYVADERFTVYYDKNVSGCTQFLCDAITNYTK